MGPNIAIVGFSPTKLPHIEGSVLRHKVIIFPSTYATCHARIRHDPPTRIPCGNYITTLVEDEIGTFYDINIEFVKHFSH